VKWAILFYRSRKSRGGGGGGQRGLEGIGKVVLSLAEKGKKPLKCEKREI